MLALAKKLGCRMAKPKAKPVVLVVVSIITTSFLIGFYIGKARSIDYNKPEAADSYLALYSHWTKIDDGQGELSLRVDDRTYRYKTTDSAVTVEYLPLEYLTSNPMPTRNLREDINKVLPLVVPVAETGLIGSILMSGNRSLQSPQGKAILVVGTLTGGVLGYYFGYDSKPQTQTPTFQAMLQSVQLWKGIERELRERYIELRASESSPLLALAHHDHPEVVEQATRDKRLHPFDDKTIFDKKDSTTPAGK